MQFQLIGTIKYWEEIHNDGMPGSEQILEEFEADDEVEVGSSTEESIY